MIYFLQRGIDGPIKIGVAVDVDARIRAHQTSNPERLNTLLVVSGGRARERKIQKTLSGSRLSGEWFHPSEEVFALMETLREPEYETVDLKAIAVLRRRDASTATTPCPFCGSQHLHGTGDGHRSAHCDNPTSPEVRTPSGITLLHRDGYIVRSHGSVGPRKR